MLTNTILILTANDEHMTLSSLSEEGKSIQRILNSVSNRLFETVLVPETSISDLIEEFKIADRSIEIIHYSGHANNQTLQFTDDNVAAQALAAKIKSHGSVKLVFLNGCATRGQVAFFHQAGVPFVIATSRPIEDKRASWMAIQFYQYLILKGSLKKAMAEVVIDAQQLTKQIQFANERGVLGRAALEAENEIFEWGLYINDSLKTPDYYLPVDVKSSAKKNGISNTVFLNKLIFALEQSDNNALTNVKKIATNLKKGHSTTDKKKAFELLKVLPYPLGIRLRQIVAEPNLRNNDYYRQLLFDYVMFFETLLYQSTFLLFAKLWQDKELAVKTKPENVLLIRAFFRQNRMAIGCDSYSSIIDLLVNWIQQYEPGAALAIGKKQIDYIHSEAFKTASDFFFLQKQYYWQKVRLTEEQAIENCFIAQDFINQIFPYFTFILKFTLASVRGINVKNFRHLPNDFDNIENVVAKLIVDDIEPSSISGRLKIESMLENKTVLSFYQSDPEIGNASLNLFPFIIDRNVFADDSNKEVDLYMFVGYFAQNEMGEPCYHFASINNPGKIWQFDEHKLTEANFLHMGEETTANHKHNHLMTKAWEFNNYLDQYKDFLLKIS